jgi:hypothetical protein
VHGGDLYNNDEDLYCHFGAAGTIFLKTTDTLYVKNKFRVPHPQLRYKRQETPVHALAFTTLVINEATIMVVPTGDISVVNFKTLVITDNSLMVEPVTGPTFSTYSMFGEDLTITNNSAFITGNVSQRTYIELTGRLFVGEKSKILYESEISIFTEESMQIFGNLEQLSINPIENADLTLILRSKKNMHISKLVKVY